MSVVWWILLHIQILILKYQVTETKMYSNPIAEFVASLFFPTGCVRWRLRLSIWFDDTVILSFPYIALFDLLSCFFFSFLLFLTQKWLILVRWKHENNIKGTHEGIEEVCGSYIRGQVYMASSAPVQYLHTDRMKFSIAPADDSISFSVD